jgi:NADH-quinone oxidoreductase subunit G
MAPDATHSTPTAPKPPETLQVKVNGRAVEVPRTHPDPLTGKPLPTTMIQACHMAGVEVPHYCYHPRLPVVGNCRMCLVEFGLPALGPDRKPLLNPDNTPKIVLQTLPYDPTTPRATIACATPVSPGMEIYTDTPTIRKVREAVLESLLINHPLDCPICDQAGECKLQEYAFQHGPATSRFVEAKVHKPKQVDLGPRIVFDAERCILCTRCIRFTRDIAGDDALGIVNRGSFNTITTYPGQAFDNNYTLNTVDICPVGALTSRDFRFQMRVWFLKETRSLCTSCGTGCNIIIGSRENRILRYEPRENDAVNASWMCDTGRLNYRWVGRPDRLREVRGPKGATAWDTVLQDLAARLQKAPKGSVAVIASARQTNEELYLLRKLAAHWGALTDAVARPQQADRLLVCDDGNPNTTGARLIGICHTETGIRIPEIAAAIRKGTVRTLVVFGEEVTGQGIDAELLGRLETLVVSDLLPNATTAVAHFLLPGAAPAEKRGSFVNVRGRLQGFLKAVEPPGDARPELEFLGFLTSQVTGQPLPATFEGLFNQMAREVPAFAGLHWAAVGDTGVTVPL